MEWVQLEVPIQVVQSQSRSLPSQRQWVATTSNRDPEEAPPTFVLVRVRACVGETSFPVLSQQ